MENNDAGTKRGKKRLIFWLILFIVCVIVAAGCLGVWVYHMVLRKAMDDLYDQARVELPVDSNVPNAGKNENTNKDKTDDTAIETNYPGYETLEDPPENEPMVRINFELLKQTSANVYAWIEIPGTEVAFPIVQHPKNNEYYLRRAINGAYDITGCIYTQNYNSLDFSDDNTIIYGHYMDDGTKFGSLLSYMDEDFFKNHRRIDIYTETHWYSYEVFAALPFDTRHILRSYKRVNDPYEAFLDDVYSSKDARTIIADDSMADADTDRIITLSTCLKTGSRRYLVLAKLVKSQLCE